MTNAEFNETWKKLTPKEKRDVILTSTRIFLISGLAAWKLIDIILYIKNWITQ